MTEREWAVQIVSKWPQMAVLELGAHHGHDTVVIRSACPRAPYIAVEADPRNIPLLRLRVGGTGVHVVHAAIAAESGTRDLHLCYGTSDASSSIRRPKAHLQVFPGVSFYGVASVPALTLDRLACDYGIGDVSLIWCDIQGAERDMIEGGRQTLACTRYLLAECDVVEMYEGQATRDQLIEMLPGWELVAEWPDRANLLFRNTAYDAA